MKKLMLSLTIILGLSLVACGNEADNEAAETKDNDVNESNVVENSQNEGEDLAVGKEKEDLTLQVLKVDEEEGITIENNEFYQAIQAEVDADPKMGDDDDFSLLPFDVVYFEDGSTSLMFIAINRLKGPIRNIAFDLTFGNQDGEYIFENKEIDLTEDYIGVLEKDGAVPFFVDITEEDVELFSTLTDENVYMEMDNFGIDFVE